MRYVVTLIACVLFFSHPGKAQWMQPDRIELGASAGFGGLHNWGMPSFDVHKARWSLRVSPGLFYLSAGITRQIYFYRPKHRKDRILLLSFYYHNDWLLSNKNQGEFRKDQHIYMLMPGIHVNLNHRGTIYLQVSAGPAYVHERLISTQNATPRPNDYFIPMGEIRIGGIFLRRKEYVQQFPLNPKPKKQRGNKQKKQKLEFKQ